MLERLTQALAGRYQIERELGRGGMASVWLARDRSGDRAVAIKVLHPELAGAIGADRFLREIDLTARLKHPAILSVLDSGTFAGPTGITIPWYSMPLVPGESLRSRLAREGSLPVEEAVRIAQDVAEALAYAHRAGIVHRDIKPENLLLADGHTWVADFGVAKALLDTGGERLTSTGIAIGTPMYMSPEQSSAEAVDARSDQYSLGCVLYEMLVGEAPFTGPTAHAIVVRRMTEPARAIRPVRPTVPAAVEAAVLRSLERIPADRFPDVGAFAAALAAPTPAIRSAATHRRVLVAGVIVAALALGLWRIGRRPPAHAAGPRDSTAVVLYQRGLHESAKRTPAGIRAAFLALNQAVARDSGYADAWAALSLVYLRVKARRFDLPGIPPDSALRLGVSAADQAMLRDRGSARAWLARAVVSRTLDPTDLEPVFRAVHQSLRLDSTDAEAWHWLAMSLEEAGKTDSAIRAWRRSVAANPSYSEGIAFLALGFYWAHQYDSAARWIDSVVAFDPDYFLGRGTAGYIAIERGEYARALAHFEAARRLTTDVELVNSVAGKALTQARMGDRAGARASLRSIDSLALTLRPTPSHSAIYLAEAYAGLGARDQAMAWLRRYEQPGDAHFQLHLRCDPPLSPLAIDPRFRALLLRPRPANDAGC